MSFLPRNLTIENISAAFNIPLKNTGNRDLSQLSRSTLCDSDSNSSPSLRKFRAAKSIKTKNDNKCNERRSKAKKAETELDSKENFKTELCKNWQFKGKCSYGKKCQFAHGEKELFCKEREVLYKTKDCHSFSEKGVCPYGIRCQFRHGNALENEWEIKSLILKALNEKPVKRLQIFEDLEKSISHYNSLIMSGRKD